MANQIIRLQKSGLHETVKCYNEEPIALSVIYYENNNNKDIFSQQGNTVLIEPRQGRQHCSSLQEAAITLNEVTFSISHPVVNDINITLMRTPQEVKDDKSVFMNQGEWELLHVLSKYKSFSVDNDDYYAEMKFHVCTTCSHCSLLEFPLL